MKIISTILLLGNIDEQSMPTPPQISRSQTLHGSSISIWRPYAKSGITDEMLDSLITGNDF
ncbi:unnamed protein product [Brassica rapa subsp. trilocularis]